MGSALTIDSSAGRGTAFPTSNLYQGMPFDRTDLRRRGYYDLANTRWVSEDYDAAFGTWNVTPYTASPTYAYIAPIASDYRVLVERFTAATQVFTTNNGTNYWQVKLRTDNSGLVIATVDTSGDPVDNGTTWRPHDTTTFTNNPTLAAATQFQIQCIIGAGAPGALYVFVKARVRDVLT